METTKEKDRPEDFKLKTIFCVIGCYGNVTLEDVQYNINITPLKVVSEIRIEYCPPPRDSYNTILQKLQLELKQVNLKIVFLREISELDPEFTNRLFQGLMFSKLTIQTPRIREMNFQINDTTGSIDLRQGSSVNIECTSYDTANFNLTNFTASKKIELFSFKQISISSCYPPQSYAKALTALNINTNDVSYIDFMNTPTDIKLQTTHIQGLSPKILLMDSGNLSNGFLETLTSVKTFTIANAINLPRIPKNLETAELLQGNTADELGSCEKLKSLDLIGWKLPRMSPLSHCMLLTDLGLADLYLKDVQQYLNGMKNITDLTIIRLEGMDYPPVLPVNLLENLTKLRFLSLASNQLAAIQRDFFKSQSLLEVLDLSDNALTMLSLQKTLVPLRALRVLKLKFNVLSQNTGSEKNCSIRQLFGDTHPPLQQLSAKNTFLAKDCPRLTEVLETLYIPTKKITETLGTLSIDHNYVSRVGPETVDALFAQEKQFIEFSGNPVICDCEGSHLIKALHSNPNMILDFQEIKCIDGTPVSEISVERLCRPTRDEIILIVVAAFALIIISLIVTYFRNQHVIKVFLYARGITFGCTNEDDLDSDRIYDAFISFAHQDEALVAEELLPQLEQEFKLCVHTRDWIPGEMINTQIIRSVEQSRRTVVLLSNHFIESIWGIVEFRTAYLSALHERRVRIIAVVLDDAVLKNEKLDCDLRDYLRTNTYVRWKDRWFWQKLRYALPHKHSQRNEEIQLKRHPLQQITY